MSTQLRLCLEALFKNDLKNSKILVVDDCSSPNEALVLPGLCASTGLPVQYLRLEERAGPAGARNEGLSYSSDPYLFFLDADVLLPPQSLTWIRETIHRYSDRPEIAGVMGVYSEVIPWKDFWTDFKNLSVCFLQKTTETECPYVHTAIFCVKREVLALAGGFDSRAETTEDFRLGITLGTKGYRFVIDRRIEGTHLKQYSLGSILKEDYRRIRDLGTIRLDPDQRAFYYRANRWTRLLLLVLPGPALLTAVLGLFQAVWGLISVALVGLFLVLSFPLLRYCAVTRGLWFTFQSAGLLFAEMIWAELVVAGTVLRKLLDPTQRRRRSTGLS